MEIEFIFQSYHEKLADFEKQTIKTKFETMIFVEDGEYSLTPKGGRQIVLTKNEIGFIPGDVEFTRKVKSPVTYYNFCFICRGEHHFRSTAETGKLKLPPRQVEALIESLRLASLLPQNREMISHVIEHTFAENYLFRSTSKGNFKPLSEEIENAIRYMQKNLSKKIDMDELAEHVFLSHSGLIWKFNQELNTTPSNYLCILRLRYAKKLLINYPYSIKEISAMCGYSSPYYFSNAFRRYSGMSPKEFRKHYLNDR